MSSPVMAAEHRVCNENHEEEKSQSDDAEKQCRI